MFSHIRMIIIVLPYVIGTIMTIIILKETQNRIKVRIRVRNTIWDRIKVRVRIRAKSPHFLLKKTTTKMKLF